MQRRWYEIALAVPPALVDEAAALLDLAGFGGVEVRERADVTDVVVVVDVAADGAEALVASKACDAKDAVAVLGARGEPRVAELDPKVWTENWKHHFAKRTFAGRIEVRPPWESATEHPDLVSIVINPGMAFGTGLHETTAGCLVLLAGEVRSGMRVADVGCGSGILAIAAARLGASEVVATDVDPLAVDATGENIAANSVADRVHVELEPGEIGIPEWEDNARPGLRDARPDATIAPAYDAAARSDDPAAPERPLADTRAMAQTGVAPSVSSHPTSACVRTGLAAHGAQAFDLVVANILAATLVEMHDMLTAAVRDGGTLILSGIEVRRLKMVEEAFIRPPWHLARTIVEGDWVSMSLHQSRTPGLAETMREPSVPGSADPRGVPTS